MNFLLLTLALLIPECCPNNTLDLIQDDSLVTFYWIGDKDEGAEISSEMIGSIDYFKIEVPSGFTVHHNWYGEGLLTSLNYKDGTGLALHIGGVMSFSVVEGEASKEYPSPTGYGTVRFGEENGKNWGAYLRVYGDMVNVLYTDAPPERNEEFAKALSKVYRSGRSVR